MKRTLAISTIAIALCIALAGLSACTAISQEQRESSVEKMEATDVSQTPSSSSTNSEASSSANDENSEPSSASSAASAESLRAELDITEDYRPNFSHGDKSAPFQKYIVLHDTESESEPANVVDYWDSNGRLVAAHFVVGKDGSIVQCVPLDEIAHHAGFGDAGHNAFYGVEDESRDDKAGTTPIGDWAPDYGMNSYSIGIEMVHVGSTALDYPEEQLAAVDALIAYIDAYYGFESQIIDHKAWRTGNSDTSAEFAEYLANYQNHRTHL